MFNIADLKTALAGYIGFRYLADEYIPIATVLRTSVSGQYWDDFHPLLHTDAIYSTAPKNKDFSDWLGEKVNGSIATLFNRLATNKKLNHSTKSIFDSFPLYDGYGPMSDTITKSGRLVGLAITPKNVNNIQVVLNQIGFQFSSIQTGFNVYLWHSSQIASTDSYSVVTSKVNSFDWKAVNFALDYVRYASDIDSGGTWYVGYFENDIIGNAIRKKYDFYSGPCTSCPGPRNNVALFNKWFKYVEICPFSVPASKLSGTNLPAIEDMEFDETNNFGMNLSLTVKPDITELITNNLSLITYPLGLQFAFDMMQWMLFNPATRINPSQMNANRAALNYALNGDNENKGIVKDLTDAINGLAEDLSNISAALPQNKPSGIRIGAI
jgi:hypothetical protein